MAVLPVVMPRLGESVAEATLSKWLVKVGDGVQVDQTLAEASTDKADTELPCPVAGRLVRVLVAEGQTVAVGSPIAEIDTAATEQPAPTPPAAPAKAPPAPEPPTRRAEPAPPPPPPADQAPAAHAGPRTSPLVRRIAKEKDVDLSQIPGSGANGRVTKKDIEGWLSAQDTGKAVAATAPVTAPPRPAPSLSAVPGVEVRTFPPLQAYKPPEYRPLPGDEVVPFTRRRRLIAEHMVFSKHAAAHTYCMAEIDMHKVDWARKETSQRGGAVSFLAYVASAVVRAVRDFPIVNATVLPDAYAVHKVVNLGIAVDTPEGLVVPVIRHAEELSLSGLTRAIAENAEKARTGKLTADDLSGGTLTLSNPGLKGNTWGAAVINQPQVAIVRMGSLVKRPVVVTIDGEDAIVIRPIMDVVLSYDHRIIDGVAANGYLHRVRELLEGSPEAL